MLEQCRSSDADEVYSTAVKPGMLNTMTSPRGTIHLEEILRLTYTHIYSNTDKWQETHHTTGFPGHVLHCNTSYKRNYSINQQHSSPQHLPMYSLQLSSKTTSIQKLMLNFCCDDCLTRSAQLVTSGMFCRSSVYART